MRILSCSTYSEADYFSLMDSRPKYSINFRNLFNLKRLIKFKKPLDTGSAAAHTTYHHKDLVMESDQDCCSKEYHKGK
jgi:hypothetical protein